MTTHPQDPALVGPFAIQGRLGRGAMGAVYLARSPGGRLVAVKVVRDELAGDAAFRARFAREIEAARRVSGAFTAAVVDADPDAERPWLATEYLAGPTLQKEIEASGPLTPGGVRSLGGGLAEALMAIHAAGLVHRDLKPSNIVLTDNGPRVIDFGIARALEEVSLTATGVVVGTPGYLSPEQITGTAIGPASDMFALGAVLVFAASSRGPFASGNQASLLHRVLHDQPQIPSLPDPLQDVVRRCLAKDPAHRPTPRELLDLLGGSTAMLPPLAQTIALPLPPTKLLPPTDQQPQPQLQPQPQMQGQWQSQGQGQGQPHQQPEPHVQPQAQLQAQAQLQSQPPGFPQSQGALPSGAAFTTSRGWPSAIAVISTLLWLGFIPQDQQMKVQHPVATALFGLVSLVFLFFAIRNWYLVLRRRVVLRLSPHGLTIERAGKPVTVPWTAITRLRITGDVRRPWLTAWLETTYQGSLPVPHRPHHGGIRIYPIAHGATTNSRNRQLNELRAALNWYAGHLHDNS